MVSSLSPETKGTKQKMRILLLHVIHDDAVCEQMLREHRRIDMVKYPEICRYFLVYRENDRHQKVAEEGDVLYVQGQETGILGITEKTIQAMRYLLVVKEESFDFVVRSNISTLFHFPRLTAFLATFPTRQIYTGSPCYHIPDNNFQAGVYDPQLIRMRYAQGTCIVWSYDQALLLLQRRSAISREVVDDVSFANFFRYHSPAAYAQLNLLQLPYYVVSAADQPEELLEKAGEAVVFRNKSIWWDTGRSRDLENMKHLIDLLYFHYS